MSDTSTTMVGAIAERTVWVGERPRSKAVRLAVLNELHAHPWVTRLAVLSDAAVSSRTGHLGGVAYEYLGATTSASDVVKLVHECDAPFASGVSMYRIRDDDVSTLTEASAVRARLRRLRTMNRNVEYGRICVPTVDAEPDDVTRVEYEFGDENSYIAVGRRVHRTHADAYIVIRSGSRIESAELDRALHQIDADATSLEGASTSSTVVHQRIVDAFRSAVARTNSIRNRLAYAVAQWLGVEIATESITRDGSAERHTAARADSEIALNTVSASPSRPGYYVFYCGAASLPSRRGTLVPFARRPVEGFVAIDVDHDRVADTLGAHPLGVRVLDDAERTLLLPPTIAETQSARDRVTWVGSVPTHTQASLAHRLAVSDDTTLAAVALSRIFDGERAASSNTRAMQDYAVLLYVFGGESPMSRTVEEMVRDAIEADDDHIEVPYEHEFVRRVVAIYLEGTYVAMSGDDAPTLAEIFASEDRARRVITMRKTTVTALLTAAQASTASATTAAT